MLERAASMRDVARVAGVSLQTVSRVANGEPHVADSKRERVLAAMADLDYRPNSAARAMRRGAYRTVGVVYHSLHSVGTHRSLEEISEQAVAHGYGTTIMPVSAASGRDATSAFTRLGEMAVDAVIVVFPSPFGLDATLEVTTAVPFVVLGPPQGGGSSSVDFDQEGGTVQAIEHLLALGHPTIHHLAGPPGSFSATARTAAWRRLLEAGGRRIPPYDHGDWSAKSGYVLARRMLETERPSAIFAANDQMALGAYRALAEAGLRIPEDVSVIGFDDVDEAAMYAPPLTTVAQDWEGLGRESLRIALSMTRGGAPEDVRLPLRLIVRDSTGPYRNT